jgi:hypothetical protein
MVIGGDIGAGVATGALFQAVKSIWELADVHPFAFISISLLTRVWVGNQSK